MSNTIQNKIEIVLQGNQFVRRTVQEVAIGTQERFIKQIIEQQAPSIAWSTAPVFQGEDIDNTGMVKYIWTGMTQGSGTTVTHVAVELNYFPLCGANLKPIEDNYILNLLDRRKYPRDDEQEYRFSQESMDECKYFDAKPLRITFQEEHNARIFLIFTLHRDAYVPCVLMLRNNKPYIPVGLPNIFPADGVLCAGEDWSSDTYYDSSLPGYSLMKHIKKAIISFSATPPNSDLSNDDEHALWGTWSTEGVLTPAGEPRRGADHTNGTAISFTKHLINT